MVLYKFYFVTFILYFYSFSENHFRYSILLLHLILCVMQETRAPAKVERKAELFQPHQTLDHERRGKGLGGLNDYDDGTYNSAKEFVFNIDPSLLIDPRLVKISQVIGEGPNSIVFEGL